MVAKLFQYTTAKDRAQDTSNSQQTTTAETSTCDKCEKHTEHLIQCEFGALWFCATCSNLSEELLGIVGDIQSLHCFCCVCDNVVSDLVANSNVNNNGSAIDQKLKAIESKLCQKMDDIEKCLKNYHTSLEEMECSDLPSASQAVAIHSVASIAATLVNEEREKERRQLNLVLHNIEESSSSDGAVRKSEDIQSPLIYRPVSLTCICCKIFEHIISFSTWRIMIKQRIVEYFCINSSID